MSQQEPIPDLFRHTNKATSRNSDPKESHEASDRMNENDNLIKSQLTVLQGYSRFSGFTSQDAAVEEAHYLTGASRELIRKIMSITKPYSKRTPELLSKELIDREDGVVRINVKGLAYIDRKRSTK